MHFILPSGLYFLNITSDFNISWVSHLSLSWFLDWFLRVFWRNVKFSFFGSFLHSMVHFAKSVITYHVFSFIRSNRSICKFITSNFFSLMNTLCCRNDIMIIVPWPLLLLNLFLWSWETKTELFNHFCITSTIINISVSIWYSPVVTFVIRISWICTSLHQSLCCFSLSKWDSLCFSYR